MVLLRSIRGDFHIKTRASEGLLDHLGMRFLMPSFLRPIQRDVITVKTDKHKALGELWNELEKVLYF